MLTKVSRKKVGKNEPTKTVKIYMYNAAGEENKRGLIGIPEEIAVVCFALLILST